MLRFVYEVMFLDVVSGVEIEGEEFGLGLGLEREDNGRFWEEARGGIIKLDATAAALRDPGRCLEGRDICDYYVRLRSST